MAEQGSTGDKGRGTKKVERPPTNPFIGLIAVIVGIALIYWLSTVFVDWNKTQACVASGGHNCSARVPLNDE